jgi:hypothetical protein
MNKSIFHFFISIYVQEKKYNTGKAQEALPILFYAIFVKISKINNALLHHVG